MAGPATPLLNRVAAAAGQGWLWRTGAVLGTFRPKLFDRFEANYLIPKLQSRSEWPQAPLAATDFATGLASVPIAFAHGRRPLTTR